MQLAVLAAAALAVGLAAALGAGAKTAPAALVHATRSAAVVAPNTPSTNWSGYAVTSSTGTPVSYTSVTGTWIVPAATCGPSDAGASSAIWVGIGGYSLTSQALEQTGTDTDCNDSSTPTYYAWYELVPSDPVNLKAKVRPGDTITTSVNILPAPSGGSPIVELQIKNRTRGWTVTKKVVPSILDTSSAEWITEAPSTCGRTCNPVPLANFGSVTIGKIATIGDGQPATLSNPAWTLTPIQLVPSTRGRGFFPGPDRFGGLVGSTAGATPGAISTDGRNFTVSWVADATSQ